MNIIIITISILINTVIINSLIKYPDFNSSGLLRVVEQRTDCN